MLLPVCLIRVVQVGNAPLIPFDAFQLVFNEFAKVTFCSVKDFCLILMIPPIKN
jgi:hypothetical protein